MTPLQQLTFESSVTKGEIAQNEQILLVPQRFHLVLIINISFMEIFYIFANICFQTFAADLLNVREGLNDAWLN